VCFVDYEEFGKFLEGLRGKTPLRVVAKKSGLSHTYIRDIELGVNRKTKAPIQPSYDTLKRLSQAYDYDYEELLRLAGILNKNGHDETDPVEQAINQKVSRMKEGKKKHLLRYIELMEKDETN
jgi:transcriptional regulator with XRE-family HTH domain